MSRQIAKLGGVKSRFVTNSEVEAKTIFAGRFSDKDLRVRHRLSDAYSDGAAPELWSHIAGEGWLFDPADNGKIKRGEVHWMHHPKAGRYEFYWKRWAKGYRDES